MPLNIDWQQILLHLFNFIILAAGLAFLLFKPVKKFMAQREEGYKKAAEDHARKVAETEALEKERQVKISALEGELAEREKKALSVTEAKKARMISEAQEEAERIVGEGRKRAETERQRYIAGVGDEIAQMIVSSAEKLLVAESNAKTDGALYDKYLSLAKDEVSPLTEEQKGELSERLKNSQGSAPHSRGEVADIIGEAAASAIMAQGAASDSAVYDQFLSEVSKKGDGNE